MHAGKHDDIGIALPRHAGEREAVADKVGDAVEDLRRLVVVGEDDGVALAFQPQDRIDVLRVGGPLERRNEAADAVIETGRAGDRPRRAKGLHGLYSKRAFPYAQFGGRLSFRQEPVIESCRSAGGAAGQGLCFPHAETRPGCVRNVIRETPVEAVAQASTPVAHVQDRPASTHSETEHRHKHRSG